MNSVFIHVIPYNDQLIIIVGYNKGFVNDWIKEYVESWNKLEIDEFERKLTNLFAARIENWGMSTALYDKMKKQNIEKFIDYTYRNANNQSSNQVTAFNLFESDE